MALTVCVFETSTSWRFFGRTAQCHGAILEPLHHDGTYFFE